MENSNDHEKNTKTLEWYKKHRREQYEYCEYVKKMSVEHEEKIKVISAPVKSGKRIIVLISKQLESEKKHIFLTSLHRKADENQHIELEEDGIKVFTLPKAIKSKCVKEINEFLEKNKDLKVVAHLDELDYGAGERQSLSYVIKDLINEPRVEFRLYSATPQVAETDFLDRNKIQKYITLDPFKPPKEYYSIKNYLEDELFHEAQDFFTYDFLNEEFSLSEQGKQLIDDLHTSDNKFIGIIRLCGNIRDEYGRETKFKIFKRNEKNIENFYKEKYGDSKQLRFKYIGSEYDKIVWDSIKTWDEISEKHNYIFVINQVAGRCTEWKCHPYLAWYHTFRGETTPAATIIQDQERPVFYKDEYNKNNKIHIYGDMLTAKLSAGYLNYDEYIEECTRKISSRLSKTKKKYTVIVESEIFDSWEDIPDDMRGTAKKTTHVNEKYRFKKSFNGINVHEQVLNINIKFIGFFMGNLRGSRNKIMRGKKAAPIIFKKDILKDLNEGINETTPQRINLFYEDNETNPNNYKFIVRTLKSVIKTSSTKNTSLYENISI